ncbi:MAG TPA: hypothetical protein VF916_00520, partial [Ktedonobacterales bacterium]
CVAYYLLSGRPVFAGGFAELYDQHLNVDPLPVTHLNPLLPPAVDTVLLRALAKDPARRFPQMLDFARALRTALDPLALTSRPGWPAANLSASARVAEVAGAPLRARRQGDAQDARPPSPVSADETTEPASGVRALRASTPRWRWPWPSAASLPPSTRGRSMSRHPDAPGSPIPRRRRRRRLLLITLVCLVLLASLGGIGWGIALRVMPDAERAAHTVAVARSGVVSLSNIPVSPAAGQGGASLARPVLVRTRWTASESTAIAQAADHVATLASLPPSASTLPTETVAPLLIATGPGQAESGPAHPGQIAVGSNGHYVVTAVDDTLQIASVQQSGQTRAIAGAILVAPVLRVGDALGQPRVLYDTDSRRWVIVLNELTGAPDAVSAGYFDLAISDGVDPLASWHVYQFSTSAPALGACTWADDPQLGSNAASYALTGNSFACGAAGGFRGATLWDVPKQAFLHGAGTAVFRFTGFEDAQQQPVFTLTPALETGPNRIQWLVSTNAGYADRGQTSNQVILWAVAHSSQDASDTLPTLVGLVMLTPYSYADPPAIAQNGTGARLRIGDARPVQVYMISGHLYIVFTTAVNWTGDTATRSGIYWLDVVTQQPASPASLSSHSRLVARVNQSGIFGFAGVYVFAPTMVAAADGEIALAAAVAAAALAPRLLYVVHQRGDPLNTLGQRKMGWLSDDQALVSEGQWGAFLGSCAGGMATADESASLWAAGVVTTGAPLRWRTQLWHLPVEGG